MCRKQITLALVLCVASASPAQEPERNVLRLGDLEAIALANNPAIAKARAELSAARHRWVQDGLYPNPRVGYFGGEMGDGGSSGKQGAFFGQEVVTGGKLRLSRSEAAWAIQQAEAAFAAQHLRVLNDVRAAHYEVLLAQRALELDRALVAIGEKGVETTEDLFDAQEVSRVDVLQARIEADTARLQLHNAEARHEAAWRRLAAVLGTPRMPPAALEGSLEQSIPRLDWDTALARVLAESPELQRARAGVERARCRVRRERVEVIPNVDLRAAVAHDNVSTDTITAVEVELPVPVFNRNQGNICRAQADLAAALSEARRVELALHRRLAAAFERYDAAGRRVARYREEILPNAQKSLELVQNGYRQGEFGYLTMLTAQRTYFRATLQYVQSLHDLWAGAVQIEGLLLEDSLGADEVGADAE